MDRKQFLKYTIFGIVGSFLCPKEIFSTPINEENKFANGSTIELNDSNDKEIPKDLIKFAKQFSEMYKKVSYGTYTSDCGKYRIDYLDNIRDVRNGKIISTPYQVGHTTGIMNFSKTKMIDMPPSLIFNAVLWCYFMYKDPSDYTKADIKSIQCSVQNGFSKKEIFIDYCNVFKNNPSDFNRNRINELYKFLNG